MGYQRSKITCAEAGGACPAGGFGRVTRTGAVGLGTPTARHEDDRRPSSGYIGSMKSPEHALRVAVAAVLLSGCHETLTQLEPQLIAPATHPALVFSGSLPELGDIVRTADRPHDRAPSGSLERIEALVSRWDASWKRGAGKGRALREEIYGAVASGAAELDAAATRSMMAAVRQALVEAGIRARDLPPHLSGPLHDARSFLAEADRARAMGDTAGWALGGLRAADALRETTPQRVALRLVAAAEEAMTRGEAGSRSSLGANGAGPAPGGDEAAQRARAGELVRWARAAIASGDHVRAIQRGYYACRLLGTVPE